MNLAIKGHATRGKEVIKIFEMLGGENLYWCSGKSELYYFFIINGEINYDVDKHLVGKYTTFTLEQFLEKFPYKVGDKVIYGTSRDIGEITSMKWDGERITYSLRLRDGIETDDWGVWELQPYKEKETMKETIKIDIPKGYEFAGVDDDNQQVVFEKIGSQYPKTYKECCKVLGLCTMGNDAKGYKHELIIRFQELLIARDAYWKIAGDWKPDFTSIDEDRYGIYTAGNKVVLDFSGTGDVNTILTFPTEEMRDAFYENFKGLIEECKELL